MPVQRTCLQKALRALHTVQPLALYIFVKLPLILFLFYTWVHKLLCLHLPSLAWPRTKGAAFVSHSHLATAVVRKCMWLSNLKFIAQVFHPHFCN